MLIREVLSGKADESYSKLEQRRVHLDKGYMGCKIRTIFSSLVKW